MTELPDRPNGKLPYPSFDGSLQWLKTRLALPLLVLNGWVLLQLLHFFDPLVTIFILAAVLAFVLNYPVQFLQQRGLGRGYAVSAVLLLAVLALATLGITLVPVLLTQLREIAILLPNWLEAAREKLQLLQSWATSHGLPVNVEQVVSQISDRIPNELQALTDESLTLALDAVDSLADVLLTLVLTFYLLLDGKRVWDGLFERLPFSNRTQLRRSLQTDFHQYFIGQLTLGLLMGVALSVAFVSLHVPYGLLLGSAIGLMTLIPFGDVVGFLAISLFVMVQDAGLGIRTLAVAVMIDQIVDQAIAPRILGSFTGLKPIWVLISLLLGTKVAGLAGLLLAVPSASFIQSLLQDDGPSSQAQPIPNQPNSASPEDSLNPAQREVN